MSLTKVIEALAIPPDARLNQRVPKKLLLEQDIPTASDKRQIQDSIEEITWVAALKPTNIGVPAYRDNMREYLEIAVITVRFRTAAKPNRLMELIHRAIPYPVFLVATHGETISVSLAHKRWSLGETGKVVIEDIHRTTPFRTEDQTTIEVSFLASLGLSGLPSRDLFALYQSWLDRVAALEAAGITGTFALPNSSRRATKLRDSLDDYARFQHDIISLRAQVEKEKQLNRRVELNLEIKRLESEVAITKEKLGLGDT
jgi:hypothetical protein